MLQNGRTRFSTLADSAGFDAAFEKFVNLHQRRWTERGEPGCFSSWRFLNFHREIAHSLLVSGKLRLHLLDIDGETTAAEYHLASNKVIYAYQSGLDPSWASCEPGRLAIICFLKMAIDEGYSEVDFLRGDEPYKAHYRAAFYEAMEVRAVHPRLAAQLRFRAWSAAAVMKRALLGTVLSAPAATRYYGSHCGEDSSVTLMQSCRTV
jgi:CelD/BcsL family acetyltransferase involved in cellulose biosynthesis